MTRHIVIIIPVKANPQKSCHIKFWVAKFPVITGADPGINSTIFGIINPKDEEPQDIILSFDPGQGNYIKTLPLHESQQVLVDNEEELQIHLKLCVTHDLLMELLSFGDSMKVIKPESLIEEIKNMHYNAFKQY